MAKVIGFFFRSFLIFTVLLSFVYGGLVLFLGQPDQSTWEKLFNENGTELGVVLVALTILSILFALWISIVTIFKDVQTNRQLKKLLEIERYAVDQNTPKMARKSLTEVAVLIDQQRKTLHRITNEHVEADETIVRQRLVEERQRLARELHDSVSQQLFAASMMLSALTETSENSAALEKVEKVVQQAQLEMRALLLHLRPIALQNKTLAQGLRELLAELQQKAYFDLHCELDDVVLSKAQEDHLFRIAQEALSNTLRHAKATDVELVLLERGNLCILRIQDNGIGFDMTEGRVGSYGLKNIIERATEVGGSGTITSVVGEGTKIEVQVMKGEAHD